MLWHDVRWWLLYGILAIWLQSFLPGVDIFALGFLLLLQSGKWRQATLWGILAVLVQEGTGSAVFGFSIIWYFFIVCCYVVGCGIFVADNRIFIFLLSAMLGAGRAFLAIGMYRINEAQPPMDRIIFEAVEQGLCIFLLWGLFSYLSNRFSNAH